ncbi:hypothetical protein NL676_037875 [Syzygium grande]|nr:hypothetical protein NL676_037875 [Syzygium grande]
MSPGLNPQNALIFRASLFRRISIIISLSMLLIDLVLSLGANPKFDDCQPHNCGSGPSISYPFWIPKVQQPCCGIPGFEIECDNTRLIYWTSESCYAIKEVSYDENSFRVVNEAVLNAGCPCRVSITLSNAYLLHSVRTRPISAFSTTAMGYFLLILQYLGPSVVLVKGTILLLQ